MADRPFYQMLVTGFHGPSQPKSRQLTLSRRRLHHKTDRPMPAYGPTSTDTRCDKLSWRQHRNYLRRDAKGILKGLRQGERRHAEPTKSPVFRAGISARLRGGTIGLLSTASAMRCDTARRSAVTHHNRLGLPKPDEFFVTRQYRTPSCFQMTLVCCSAS